jgi:hypothetical protein
VSFQRDCQGLLHRGGDVPDVDERAVLPERFPFRARVGPPLCPAPLVHAGVPDVDRSQRHRGDAGPGGEARTQVFGQELGQAVGARRPARVLVIDREVVREALALSGPEHLRAGEMDYPRYAGGGLRREQHVPGAEHIDRHDLFWAARIVVRDRAEVRDRIAALRRALDRREVKQIIAVGPVKATDLMSKALQMVNDRAADTPAVPGNKDPHNSMIGSGYGGGRARGSRRGFGVQPGCAASAMDHDFVLYVAGPGGRTLSSGFQEVFSVSNGFGMCGAGLVFDDTSAQCQPSVTIPAGAPAGTWTVSKLSLWDNAGNHATYAHLNVLPITVTSDSVIRASAFSANPTQVDNWVNTATSQLSMKVTGAVGGVATIYVDFTAGSPCGQGATSPTQNPDGSYSVDISMFSIADSCSVAGIAVLDGAGDLSVYGSEYGLPDLGINLTRVPDTTPPVATGAQVSPASQPTNPNSTGFEGLTVDVNDTVAPVNQISTTVFNSSGQIVGGGFGGVTATLTGPVTTSTSLPVGLPPGTYTVAFQLIDKGGLISSYGYPNSPPVPGGPLVFTVTP